ncbi:MAG: catalytic domain of component of various dehydrogenase complexe [Propionibacteriaceae bacterium]|nr:catalytic domain of component of various dehydrogenase complexe [Propionibacteriaceae bacterium]
MMSAPWPLPRLFVRLTDRAVSRRDPTRVVTAAGTVGVTALGMVGRGGGWGLAPEGQSLLLIVGGIARKPAVIEERVEPRDLLNVTIAFDHDVVDGAPAARFIRRLVDLTISTGRLIRISPVTLAMSARLFPLGRRNDRIELVLQPADQVFKVRTVLRVDDHGDGEHAGVRQHLEGHGDVPALANRNRNSLAD